jgi:hypothetical protein
MVERGGAGGAWRAAQIPTSRPDQGLTRLPASLPRRVRPRRTLRALGRIVMARKPAARAKAGRGASSLDGRGRGVDCRRVRLVSLLFQVGHHVHCRARPWDRSTALKRLVPLGLGAEVKGEPRELGNRAAGPAARGSPWHPAGRPRGTGTVTPPISQVSGSRRCSLPASHEDVGEGLWRTNRTGQSQVPGTDPPERNHQAKSRTARSPKAAPAGPVQDPRGARPRSAEQTPHGPRRPFIVGRFGEGVTEARTTPGRTWAMPTPQDASRKGRWRRARSGLGHGPTTPGPSPGWRAWQPADCPRVSRKSTGRAGSCKRGFSKPWCRSDPPGAQVPGRSG